MAEQTEMAQDLPQVENSSIQTPKTQTCTFFKRSTKGKNIRKRVDEESDGDEPVIRKTKQRKAGLSFGTSREEEETRAHGFVHDSSREIQTHSDGNATATLETETEFDKDARSLREKMLKNAAESLKKREAAPAAASGDSTEKKALYKGTNNYTDHRAGLRRENNISGEKAGGAHGPLRASAHIRMSVRIDYQPDVCKDYKETGYCGFGDSCKFLHDRGDYKAGWQLEKDWEEAQKAKKQRKLAGLPEEEAEKDSDDEDELPFACFICREVFVNPVMTKCKHYFCEKCALEHFKKTKNCFVCNKPTLGIFNTAHAILKRARS